MTSPTVSERDDRSHALLLGGPKGAQSGPRLVRYEAAATAADGRQCATPGGEGLVVSHGVVARGLALAASPTFAVMALLAAVEGSAASICVSGTGLSTLTGMASMYLLMSIFHAAPWLRLATEAVHARAG